MSMPNSSAPTATTCLLCHLELIGTIDQIVEDLIARRERFGISYITVFHKYMKDFALVIERLSGQ